MSWSSSVIEQRPAGTALRCVAGLPFIVTVELQDGSGDPLTGVSDVTAGVFTLAGQELAALAPGVANLSTGVYSLSWSGDQTAMIGQVAAHSYSFGCVIASDGPYAILAGGVSATPPNVAGSSTATTLPVAVTVGGGTVQVTVALGGGGGDAATVLLGSVEWLYLNSAVAGFQMDPYEYVSADAGGPGDTVVQSQPAQAQASVTADSAPSFPLTIAAGVNDTFQFQAPGWASPVETFTMAPIADITTLPALEAVVAAATGTNSDTFGQYVAVTDDGSSLVFTAVASGPLGNGGQITEGDGGAAAIGVTSPPDVLSGGSNGVLAVDGGNPEIGDRVGFDDTNNPSANGVYVVTAVGDGVSSPWVMTRASDNDTAETLGNAWEAVVGPTGIGNAFGPGAILASTWSLPCTIGTTGINCSISGPGSTASGPGSIAVNGSFASGGGSIASGGDSTAIGGGVATGDQSVAWYYAVASGSESIASGEDSTASGFKAIASGRSALASGEDSTASGPYSIASGPGATSEGPSIAWGPWYWSFSSGSPEGAPQRSQYSFWVPYGQTTDDTPTLLGVASSSPTGPPDTFALVFPDFITTALIEARIVARRIDVPGTVSVWECNDVVVDGDGIGAYRLVGSQTVTVIQQDAAAEAWEIALALTDDNTGFQITVTGADGATINWTCTLKLYEITG